MTSRRAIRCSACGAVALAPLFLILVTAQCAFSGLDAFGIPKDHPSQGLDASESGGDAATSVRDARGDTSPDAPRDARADASDASVVATMDASEASSEDAAVTVTVLPDTCPTGTIYSEPFTTNPLLPVPVDDAGDTAAPWIALSPNVSYVPPSGEVGGVLSLAYDTNQLNIQAWIGTRPQWTNYTVSVQVRIDDMANSNGNGGLTFRMVSTPPMPANNGGEMYYAGFSTNNVQLSSFNNGTWLPFGSAITASFSSGTFHTLVVTVSGTSIKFSVDGTQYFQTNDSTWALGSIGFRTYIAGMSYQNLTVTCD
jgi:hypothetical protein